VPLVDVSAFVNVGLVNEVVIGKLGNDWADICLERLNLFSRQFAPTCRIQRRARGNHQYERNA
jgi:hypothetical protein